MSTIKKKNKNAKHYIDNDKFYAEMCEYKAQCEIVEKDWLKIHGKDKQNLIDSGLNEKKALLELPDIPWPRVNEYIGKCMYLIADKINNSPNFRNYSYREEMIADGYEDCILRIRSFNPEKTNNPFAYFTQACYYASVRRIKKEQRQQVIKASMVHNSGILTEMSSVTQDSDNTVYNNTFLDFLQDAAGEKSKAEEDNEPQRKKTIKKTTKAHQQRMRDLEEKERIYSKMIEEEVDTIEDEDSSY